MRIKKRSNRSPIMKRKRKSFNRSSIPKRRLFNCNFFYSKLNCLNNLFIIHGSKKKKTQPEMSTAPATMSTIPTSVSIPPRTFASLATKSTPPVSAYISLAMSIPPVTLTTFPQLPYSSPTPISTPSPLSSIQSACAKPITEIMKEHFVKAHASFGKIPDRTKNLWYTEFGKREAA
ncbi:hypothetical protein M9H77_17262 [Catharanthus roseus]|uniref:Uncharacterized protein n=1 Tax=Catharanthus roseus TaxID=4058 RepID=A0ACC0B437_CATRO|nr:hypothetical protein M9H77_17262 [Catharanthus roseus]